MPYLSLPTVGLMEATPLKCAGILKLPPISVPVPNMHPCAPTKLPVPELLPPGLNLGFVAFTVHPNTGLSLPYLIKVKITKTMKHAYYLTLPLITKVFPSIFPSI